MKTFLDFFNAYKNDKSVKFSIYYVVKGMVMGTLEDNKCIEASLEMAADSVEGGKY